MPSRSAYWVRGASIPGAVCRAAALGGAVLLGELGECLVWVRLGWSAGAAHQAARHCAGRLAVLERDSPRLDRGHVSRGLLEQAAPAGRQVVGHVRGTEGEGVVVDRVVL